MGENAHRNAYVVGVHKVMTPLYKMHLKSYQQGPCYHQHSSTTKLTAQAVLDRSEVLAKPFSQSIWIAQLKEQTNKPRSSLSKYSVHHNSTL